MRILPRFCASPVGYGERKRTTSIAENANGAVRSSPHRHAELPRLTAFAGSQTPVWEPSSYKL